MRIASLLFYKGRAHLMTNDYAAAESDFREGRTRPRRAADIDALAARIILQSYLDQPEAHERLAS